MAITDIWDECRLGQNIPQRWTTRSMQSLDTIVATIILPTEYYSPDYVFSFRQDAADRIIFVKDYKVICFNVLNGQELWRTEGHGVVDATDNPLYTGTTTSATRTVMFKNGCVYFLSVKNYTLQGTSGGQPVTYIHTIASDNWSPGNPNLLPLWYNTVLHIWGVNHLGENHAHYTSHYGGDFVVEKTGEIYTSGGGPLLSESYVVTLYNVGSLVYTYLKWGTGSTVAGTTPGYGLTSKGGLNGKFILTGSWVTSNGKQTYKGPYDYFGTSYYGWSSSSCGAKSVVVTIDPEAVSEDWDVEDPILNNLASTDSETPVLMGGNFVSYDKSRALINASTVWSYTFNDPANPFVTLVKSYGTSVTYKESGILSSDLRTRTWEAASNILLLANNVNNIDNTTDSYIIAKPAIGWRKVDYDGGTFATLEKAIPTFSVLYLYPKDDSYVAIYTVSSGGKWYLKSIDFGTEDPFYNWEKEIYVNLNKYPVFFDLATIYLTTASYNKTSAYITTYPSSSTFKLATYENIVTYFYNAGVAQHTYLVLGQNPHTGDFWVESTDPADGDTNEPVLERQVIKVTFNKEVDADTVEPGNLDVYDEGGLDVEYEVALVDDVDLYLLTAGPYHYNATYTCYARVGLKDTAAEPLEAEYPWDFSTASGDSIWPYSITDFPDGPGGYTSSLMGLTGNKYMVIRYHPISSPDPIKPATGLENQEWI